MKTMKISMNALTITIETAEDIHCTVIPSTTSCASTLCIEKLCNSANTTNLTEASSTTSDEFPLSDSFGIRNIEINDSSVIFNDGESKSSGCFVANSNGLAKINNNAYPSNQCLQNLSISLISKSGSKIASSASPKPQSRSVACGKGEPNLIFRTHDDSSMPKQECILNTLDKELVPDNALKCVDVVRKTKLERSRSEPDISADDMKNPKQHVQRSSRKHRGISSSRLEEKSICEMFDPLINLETNEIDSGYSATSQKTVISRTQASAKSENSRKTVASCVNTKDVEKPKKTKLELEDIFSAKSNRKYYSEGDQKDSSSNPPLPDHQTMKHKVKKCHSAQPQNPQKKKDSSEKYVKKFERKPCSKQINVKDSLEDFNKARLKMAEERERKAMKTRLLETEKYANKAMQLSKCPPEWEKRKHTTIVYDVEYENGLKTRENNTRSTRSGHQGSISRPKIRSRDASYESDDRRIYYEIIDDEDIRVRNSIDHLDAINPFIEEYLKNNCGKNKSEVDKKSSLMKTDAAATLMDIFQNNIYGMKSEVHPSISQISSPYSLISSTASSDQSYMNRKEHSGSTLKAKPITKGDKNLPSHYTLKGTNRVIDYESFYVPRCRDCREEDEPERDQTEY